MKLKLFAVSALASTVVLAGPALAQLTPGTTTTALPASPSATSQSTAVSSGIQSQSNTTAYVVLPGISSVIQQSLLGPKLAGPRAGAELSPVHSGMAAGDDPWGWQAWIQGGGGNTVNSLATGGYNIANYGAQIGVQAQITPKFLFGVSGSWQGSNGTLNGGYSSNNATLGITAYAGWQFNENWNASAMVGYSGGTNTLTNSAFTYNANYQSSQWNFQGGLNGYYKVGAVVLAPMVSILYSPINSFGYTDSNLVVVPGQSTSLTRGSAGGFISLPLEKWQPYVRATIEQDFALPTGSGPNGSTGGTVGVGATIPINDSLWASIDGGYNSIGRVALSSWSGSARLSLRF
ncbi:MAG: autotransporter outer membrane beta-barrel domain-containing protein [Reyranella sp.]|uniref:autotransporter outer membrane beta-barrel domain-containing protein n=1 Tax=Reyranella sp. TaxID=1929291 RepID=UPI002730B922|nr:autotransporter outer membrane beta-barrel domain-containing protein [Reyranella sp.]MDP1966699.1 autotransporter outer membrane beta-barrel domain-containing protein [Reyranella sp.]MDP2372242.1 autotransporter outer membrane beta-barrel domain-containing protein [Reyranella sp.]